MSLFLQRVPNTFISYISAHQIISVLFSVHRICLNPLLYELNSNSFRANNFLLNGNYLNAKGIYSAYIASWYYNNGTKTWMTLPNSSPYIHYKEWMAIEITLPTFTLIKGYWWSTYNQVCFDYRAVPIKTISAQEKT